MRHILLLSISVTLCLWVTQEGKMPPQGQNDGMGGQGVTWLLCLASRLSSARLPSTQP